MGHHSAQVHFLLSIADQGGSDLIALDQGLKWQISLHVESGQKLMLFDRGQVGNQLISDLPVKFGIDFEFLDICAVLL